MPDRDEHLRERLVERVPVFEGRLLRVYDDEVELADGSRSHREVVLHPGAVAVVAVADDGRVVLVRQWRHAVGEALWEITAGTCEPDEAPASTAARELAEETGFSAARWTELGQAWMSPGFARERMVFFRAEGLTAGATGLDADERVEVRLVDLVELGELIRGAGVDCKTLAGLALAGLLPHTDASPA